MRVDVGIWYLIFYRRFKSAPHSVTQMVDNLLDVNSCHMCLPT
jgi:hypothetical protein